MSRQTLMITKKAYTDLKEYWDYQRLLEYNREKLKDKLKVIQGKVFNQYGPLNTDAMFDDIWTNVESHDLDKPPVGWIPKDKKLRFEWELGD